jgi:anti-sigma regulatory factor (Ser/Thr protein kinase)
LAAFAASPFAVGCRGATVVPGPHAIPGRRRAIVRSRSALGLSGLGLIFLQRVADRRADVTFPGRPVPRLRRTVSRLSRAIGLVELVLCAHHSKPIHRAQHGRLAARRAGQTCGMPRARWSASASAENVPQIRQAVVDFAYAHGTTEARARDIELAISEAVTNAVVHAYRHDAQPGSVHVDATIDGAWLELLVVDDGVGAAARTDSPGLGLGLPLIQRVADQVELRSRSDHDGTELWMRFRLDTPAAMPGT